MSRAVIGAGGKPSGWDRRIEGRYSPSSQLQCRVGMKVRESCSSMVIAKLNKAQMAQTGKAGAVRLCTYRCRELGPHLLMLGWRTLERHSHAAAIICILKT